MDAADLYRVLTQTYPELREKHGPAKLRALADRVGVEEACGQVQRLCDNQALTEAACARIRTPRGPR